MSMTWLLMLLCAFNDEAHDTDSIQDVENVWRATAGPMLLLGKVGLVHESVDHLLSHLRSRSLQRKIINDLHRVLIKRLKLMK